MPDLVDPAGPNEMYAKSKLLFWTIVATGSRKNVNDPTLILTLGPRVQDIAKGAIFAPGSVLLAIQALIILCCWPMPFEALSNDNTPVIAGAALQLAMSIGLHVYGTGQDFARSKVDGNHKESLKRAKIWTLCLLICQRYLTRDASQMPRTANGPPSLG